jgi:hypothetical protein
MSRRNPPLSAVDEAAIKAIAAANKATNDALAELTRAIAAQPDKPRRSRSYRLANVTRGADGEITGDMEYSDGRVRRFRFARCDDGEIDGEIEDFDREADATPAPTTEAAPEPGGEFAGVFGSLEG